MKDMTTLTLFISMMVTKNMNPITMASMVLITSIMTTFLVMKSTITSWLAFVTILTFSSGMMTLFMYTASLSSNEVNQVKKSKLPIFIFITLLSIPIMITKPNIPMKMFTNQIMLTIMAMTLILTLLTISNHGHHPNQTLSTSF